MKNLFIMVALFWGLPFLSLAQKEDYNWVVRDNITISFTDTVPYLQKMPFTRWDYYSSAECHAAFSDSLRNLLLYTQADFWQHPFLPDTVWRNRSVIRNGKRDTILNGDNIYMDESVTNGAFFIKSHDKIYLFHLCTWYVSPPPTSWHDSLTNIKLFMTVIEQKDSNWVVTEKNKMLSGKLRLVEKLAAVRHANGQDWWIITHDFNRNIFHTFLFRNGEITDSFSQEVGYAFKDNDLNPPFIGEIAVSPDGSMILLANCGGDLNKNPYDTELFHFDRCCGKISFYKSLKQKNFYGAAFSPNGKFIYLSKIYGRTYQYETDPQDIVATEVQVSPTPPYSRDWGWGGAQLELGPDNRLYSAAQSSLYSAAILYPDKKGTSCTFKPDFVYGEGNIFGGLGLPSFPNYRLGALAPAYYHHDTTVCPDKKTAIGIPPDCDYAYEWSPATGLSDSTLATPTVKISKNMTYVRRTFSFRFGCTLRYDTFFVKVLEKNVPPCTSNARPEDLSPFELSIYPNPTSETATLNYKLPKNVEASVLIIDVTGRLLFSFPLTKDKEKHEFSVKDLSAGVYLIEVRLSNGEKMIQKLTVQD